MWPPTRGSKTVSLIAAPSRLCSGGLKSPNRSVNAVKACSTGALTTTCLRTTGTSVRVMNFLRHLFGHICVAGQSPLPEGVELIAQRGHGHRIEPVDAPGAGRALTDQAGVLQDLQVLGDRRPADRQFRGQLSHRLRPVGQAADDGAPGAIRQHAPAITYSVRIH